MVNIGEWMKVSLDVNINARTVDYTISDIFGNTEYVKGQRIVPEDQSMYVTGINQHMARRNSIVQMDNINVSVYSAEDIANPPTVALTGVNGTERTYTITFGEEEELNIIGTDGKEEAIFYMDCDGSYKYTTTTSGTLQAWTVSGSATSEKVTVEVECVMISLPGATANIVAVEDGYAKTYQLIVSNAEVPTQPTIFIMYEYKNEKGEIEVAAEDKFSGEKVDVKEKGVLTVTTVAPGFASTTVEVANDKAFTTTHEIDFQHMTAEELIAKGFEALDPLDSETTSGENNWTGRQRLYYQIENGGTDDEGKPTYDKYLVWGPSTIGGEPIQRYQYLDNIFLSFDPKDTRRDATFKASYSKSVYEQTGKLEMVGTHVHKNIGYTNDAGVHQFIGDFMYYRLPLVYLSLAEIANYEGNGADVAKYINLVRKRAYGSNWNEATYGYTAGSFTANELAILGEKDREFLQEGQRWHDLRRMTLTKDGKHLVFCAEANPKNNGRPILDEAQSHKLLWPIDKNVMNSDKELKQTPGY